MKIAHLSDPHFANTSFKFGHFLSKRWLGNLNLILFRQHRYQTEHLWELPELLKSLHVDWISMTGDMVTTALDEEFQEAARWMAQMPAPSLIVPGNHDVYTRRSEKEKRFYNYFPNEEMKVKRISVKSLGNRWWWIGLDCAIATSVLFSNGKFFSEMEKELEESISRIPAEDSIIIANHFPLFRSGNLRHDLSRCGQLQAIVRKHPQIKLYLHGHEHSHYLLDRTKEGYPLVLNAGSCAYVPGGIFYIIDLEHDECWVQKVQLEEKENAFSWVFGEKTRYLFQHLS